MRKLLITILLIIAINGISQTGTSSTDFAPAPRLVAMGSLPPVEKSEDVQTKFIKQQWSKGSVSFKNSVDKVEVPLLFDVYSNKLYFNKDNTIMEFENPVYQFSIQLVTKADSANIIYRNSYPPIDKNDNETFYEVLTEGKIHLLKCKAKTIYLHKEQNIPEEARTYSRELFYVYLPGNKMVGIKKDKDDLMKQLPEYAGAIQTAIETRKLKIKNEQSLKELFAILNQNK